VAECTQCQEIEGTSASAPPHECLVRGTLAVFREGVETAEAGELEWYRCTECGAHLVRERDRVGAPTTWSLAKKGAA
jgi:hypothetical protein